MVGTTNGQQGKNLVFQRKESSGGQVAVSWQATRSITWDKPFKDDKYLLSIYNGSTGPMWSDVTWTIQSKTASGVSVMYFNHTGAVVNNAVAVCEALGEVAG